jgi:hypothetical protein
MQNEVISMDDRTLDINMDVEMDDQAQQQLTQEQEQQEAEAASQGLREVLRDYDLSKIIEALGVNDVLDIISAHTIMDHVVYIVKVRKDMKEPGSRRMIFRREVLALAEEIESEW